MKQVYYVYLHRRRSDGIVFYVGKGIGRRAWKTSITNGRSRKWQSVYYKHGLIVDIAQENLSEENAFLLEMWLIAKFRHEGYDLCNMTDGGEGGSGYKWTEEAKKVKSSQMSNAVYNHYGMRFKSTISAAYWLRDNGIPGAARANISAAARGLRGSAYGFAWWYEGDEPKSLNTSRYCGVKVVCSNGITFDSSMDAESWLKGEGFDKASQSHVIEVCKGKRKTAYGYSWTYANE